MPYANNNGARLYWQEIGEGTPLLLVMGHGYSSAMWYAAVPELAQHHRVITFDNRGTGRSSKMRKISVGAMARDAFAVLDAAGVESAHVYGVSMGGGIILEMARQRPERVRSLVLGCTVAKTFGASQLPRHLRLLLRLPAPIFIELQKRLGGPPSANRYGTRASAENIARDASVIAAERGRSITSVAQTRAIAAYSISAEEVQSLRMPALVLHGDEDTRVAYAAGLELHRLIAHSEMVTLHGAGHNYFVAAGKQANEAVQSFLRRVDNGEVGPWVPGRDRVAFRPEQVEMKGDRV
jgi:3-oxoadipate enol-lactonase